MNYVFVQIALGVAVMHRDGVDHVGDLIQQRWSRDDERRVFHEAGARAARAAIERFDKRKHLVAEHGELALGVEILETRPAQIALLRFENGIVDRFAGQAGLFCLCGMQLSSGRLANNR